MNALILAAGRGTRLRSLHEPPKCLLEIGGIPLLDRYVRSLESLGIDITIVAGYRAGDIRSRVATLAPTVRCDVVINEDYELGSIVSLARGLHTVNGALLLLDGDVLFHSALMSRIAESAHANALLVDVGSSFTGEEYMTGIDRGRIHALRRSEVGGHETTGEWVGFARLDGEAVRLLRAAIAQRIAGGETTGGYEDALASILPEIEMRVIDTGRLPWIEIDFPGDAERGELLAKSGDV